MFLVGINEPSNERYARTGHFTVQCAPIQLQKCSMTTQFSDLQQATELKMPTVLVSQATRPLAGANAKCANVHSLSETLTNGGSWCKINQSRILPSPQQRSIRISVNARFFPALIVGPYENGKNAAVLCSPAGAPVLNHHSGRNASDAWKFRGSR